MGKVRHKMIYFNQFLTRIGYPVKRVVTQSNELLATARRVYFLVQRVGSLVKITRPRAHSAKLSATLVLGVLDRFRHSNNPNPSFIQSTSGGKRKIASKQLRWWALPTTGAQNIISQEYAHCTNYISKL